jgi:tRNA(fMet)-specific endonuclease VapC
MSVVYMLDTKFCSFNMRERQYSVLERLQIAVENQHRIVISVIKSTASRVCFPGRMVTERAPS